MSHLSEEQLDQIVAEERERELPPLNDWRTIAARAREEGLIRESSPGGWVSRRPWMQAAAAMLLLTGGVAIGRATTGLPGSTPGQNPAVTAGTPSAPNAGMVSGAGAGNFASIEDASATLDRAVADYNRATAYLAATNVSGGARDSAAIYSTRLTAFDKIVDATESALQTAPHDPVINQYYLATMGARAATRQMVARPVTLRGF